MLPHPSQNGNDEALRPKIIIYKLSGNVIYWQRYITNLGEREMNNIFIGFLFVYLDFNITFGTSRVGLIPDFIGFILIAIGVAELTAGNDRFSRVRPLAIGMAVYTGLLYGMDLLGVSYNLGILSFLLGLASLIVSFYISYSIVRGVQDLEVSLGQNLNGGPLYSAWLALAVCTVAIYVLILVPGLNVLCVIVSLVIGIVFLVMFSKTKNLYYYGK
jgi:hypothetical protein